MKHSVNMIARIKQLRKKAEKSFKISSTYLKLYLILFGAFCVVCAAHQTCASLNNQNVFNLIRVLSNNNASFSLICMYNKIFCVSSLSLQWR